MEHRATVGSATHAFQVIHAGDVSDGVDPVLALAVLWGVDRLAEQR